MALRLSAEILGVAARSTIPRLTVQRRGAAGRDPRRGKRLWSAGGPRGRRGGGAAARGRRCGERDEGFARERGKARGHHSLTGEGEELLADHERAVDLRTREVDRVVGDPPDFRDAGAVDVKPDRSDERPGGFRDGFPDGFGGRRRHTAGAARWRR